jgi:hypothetical protein
MFSTRKIFFLLIIAGVCFFFLASKNSSKFSDTWTAIEDRNLNSSQFKDMSSHEPIKHRRSAATSASDPEIVSPQSSDKSEIRLPDQVDDPHRPSSASRLAKFGTGVILTQGQGSFEMLNLHAISKASYSAEMGELVSEKMNMVIFNPSPHATNSLPSTFPVVMKNSNGSLGLISGTLLVTMSDINQAGIIGQRHGLSLKAQDSALGLAFFVVPKVSEINLVMANLRQDPSVKSVEAEIVQNWKKR